MIEKYTFNLQSPKVKVAEKLILVKSDLELRSHVVLKILAYLLFYESGLRIEAEAGMHYRPDLVILGEHGVPRLWIDCGKIAVRKIRSLAEKLRSSRIVIVKETVRELEGFKKLMDKKLEIPSKIEYLAFDAGFVAGLSEALDRKNDFTLYDVTERVIGVALNDEVFESVLHT